jgi:HEAT repeat protein
MRKMFSVQSGEGRSVVLVALLFVLAEASRALGEIGIDTLVSLRLGPQHYPSLFVVLGVVSLVISLAYGAAVGRLPRRPLFTGMPLGIAGVLLAGLAALRVAGDGVLPALWVATFTSSALILTLTWTVAGAVFDARQAKRLFPIAASAAIVGSLVGNLAAGPMAAWLGTESLLLVEALLLLGAAVVLSRTPLRLAHADSPRPGGNHRALAEVRAGLDFVASSPLMRLIALSYLLFSVLAFSVTYPYFTALSTAFPDEAAFATANGLVQTAATASSLLLSLLVAARLYARFGVVAAGLLLPLAYLAGFGLWIVSFGAATAILVRWLQISTQRGLSNAAWTAMYNVVPAYRRAQVLAFNDGVPGQLGIILSGLLLLAAQRFLGLAQIFWLGATAAAICIGMVLAMRRRYAASLITALRSGLAEQVLGGPGARGTPEAGPDVLRALATTLQDPDPGVRRLAAALLGQTGSRAPQLIADAVADPDPGVRTEIVGALAASGPDSPTWPLVLDRLSDASPQVRSAAAAGLARHGDHRGSVAIAELLGGGTELEVIAGLQAAAAAPGEVDESLLHALARDQNPAIRAVAVRSLGAVGDAGLLVAALDDELPAVRSAAVEALSHLAGAESALLRVLREGSGRAQEAAVAALRHPTGGARNEVEVWALDQIERGLALRAALYALPDDPADERLALLHASVERRLARLQDRVVLAASNLDAADAAGVLRRSLVGADPDVRAQAVEALESVVSRRLGRALASLLESAPPAFSGTTERAFTRLARDGDRWISFLAVLCSDSAAGGRVEGVTWPVGVASVAELETMIFLRRVPLFRDLDPEDLHRLAQVVQDRWFPPGSVLIREGDPGDELIVVVEGSVQVLQTDPGGQGQRLVRRCGPGEHVGELAVLRKNARAGTVVADDSGVRGLVLGGPALQALVRERPEAAVAMLATLAERIAVAL